MSLTVYLNNMVAIGKAIDATHGAANINYLMTKEKAQLIRTNQLGNLLDPDDIWMNMEMRYMNTRNLRKANHKIDCPYFEFEISPDISETKGWKLADFENLLDEFIDEMDKIDLSEVTGHKGSKDYDLNKVQYVAAVHYDSKSQIPHIHLGGSRVMANGQLLDHSKLTTRIMEAVHKINVRHGWALPEDIHKQHLNYINDACMKALGRMKTFNWESYGRILAESDLDFKPTYDSNNNIVNYVILFGNSKFKASTLGVGRNLTVKNIEGTWKKIKDAQAKEQQIQKAQEHKLTEQESVFTSRIGSDARQQSVSDNSPKVSTAARYTQYIDIDGKTHLIDVPQSVYDYFKDNCNVPEGNTNASKDDIIKVSLLLFMELVDAATSVSESCGGGGSCDSGWGRKNDEDDDLWKKRCLMQAHHMCSPKKISYHRGRH